MPITFKVDTGKVTKQLLTERVVTMKKLTDDLYAEINRISPVDTWTYKKSNRNEWVQVDGNKVIWKVSNNSEYAERVEFWFGPWWRIWWRQTAVTWHPTEAPNYRWRWARVYSQSIDKLRPTILNKLR